MRLLFASLCVIVLVTACNSSQALPASQGLPTAPDPLSAPGHTVFGIVTTGGMPVVGARVAVRYPGGTDVGFAITDGNGYYSLSDVRPGPRFGGEIMVFVSEAGYFMEFTGTALSKDTQLDVALHPWVYIPLDAATRGHVGDTICEGSGPCERYALTPPSAGTLELTAAAFPFDVEVLNPNGQLVGSFYPLPGSSPPLQLRIRIDAGRTYEIHVVHFNGPTRDFELTAALR